MIDKIKYFIEDLWDKLNPTKKADDEVLTPEEQEKARLIRRDDVNYRNETDKIQVKNFFRRFISILRAEGWGAKKIVEFFRKYFSKTNQLNVWKDFSLYIRQLAGLTDLDNFHDEIDEII